jgi:DNA-binding transcriptional LysR family regulator
MRLSQIDLNLFVVFDTIYSRRSLTRAAETLNITQPAVSNSLARLRKVFNDPLFINSRQGMVPTPLADNIVGPVGEALRLLNLSVQQAQHFDPQQANKTFRLSMSDLAETLLLPRLGQSLRETAPGIRIESYYTPRPELARELAAGRIDLAIDAPLLADPQLCHSPLIHSSYVCMMRKHHPLVQSELTLADYLKLGHVHVSSRREGFGHVDAALDRLGHARQIHMRVPHYLVAHEIVLQTDLVLTAPRLHCHAFDACVHKLPLSLEPVELHMFWHRTADQDQANQWLRKQLLACTLEDQSQSVHG